MSNYSRQHFFEFRYLTVGGNFTVDVQEVVDRLNERVLHNVNKLLNQCGDGTGSSVRQDLWYTLEGGLC